MYEQERVNLIREYGDKMEGEGIPKDQLEVTDPEKLKIFYEKLDEVLGAEIAPEYTLLSEKELDSIDSYEIDVNELQMKALFEFIFEPIKGISKNEKAK